MMTMILLIVLLIILWFYHRLTFWKRQGLEQSLFHLMDVVLSPMHLADQELVRRKGKIVGTYELFHPTIIVADPELVNEVLIKNFRKFSDHRTWLPSGAPFTQSVFNHEYSQWKPTREVLKHLFTSGKLRRMQSLIENVNDNTMKNLANLIKTNKTNDIDVKHLAEGSVMDVILRCIFSTVVDSVNEPDHPLVYHLRLLFGNNRSAAQMMAFSIPRLMWKGFGVTAVDIRGLNFLVDISKRIIEERNSKQNNGLYRDLLQLLMDAEFEVNGKQQKFSVAEIVDNCIAFLIAGHDTTSTTIINAIYNLATNPEVQEMVYDEIDNNKINIDDSFFDVDKLMQLEYLDAFFNESQRFLMSVCRIERQVTDDCRLGPAYLPKGAYVTIPIYAIHRDPDNFEEPNVFKIERFLGENRKRIRPGTFIPFADGPRNCIGMRFAVMIVKLTLAKLIRKYKFVATDKTVFEPVKCWLSILPEEMIVKFEERLK